MFGKGIHQHDDENIYENGGICLIYGFACLAPKNYFIFDINFNLIKKGFKGINLKNDLLFS